VRARLHEVIESYGETKYAVSAKKDLGSLKGNLAKDASGKGHDLEIYGCRSVTGRFGKALQFNGSTDFCEHPNNGVPKAEATALTIEAWVKVEKHGDSSVMIVNREQRYELQIGAETRKGKGTLEAALGIHWDWRGGGKVPEGKWTHVAVSWDGKAMRLFVGGKLVATHDLPDGAACGAGGSGMRVGARGAPQEPHAFFKGVIDEMRISTSARYTKEFAVPAGPFKADAATAALWHLDDALKLPGAAGLNPATAVANQLAARKAAAGAALAGIRKQWKAGELTRPQARAKLQMFMRSFAGLAEIKGAVKLLKTVPPPERADGTWEVVSGFANAAGAGFANPEGAGFATAYPPEKGVDTRAIYRLADGSRAFWRQLVVPGPDLNLQSIDGRLHNVYYAFAYLRSERKQQVTLMTNSDDGIKVWLNGKLVVTEDVYRPVVPADDKATRIMLNEGLNPVLVKVTQGVGEAALRFYITFCGATVA